MVGYTDCLVPSNCTSPKHWDEIAHAVLIPAGAWPDPADPLGATIPLAGKFLVWTTCDDWNLASGMYGYKTYVIDPDALQAGATFAPPILVGSGGGPLPNESGIFCSGHTWMLDDLGNPKLLVVGGVEYGAGCEASFGGMPCGLKKAYWFDPLASGPDTAWSDFPADLPDRNWYPSVITYRGSGGSKFQPIAFGGSGVRPPGPGGCGSTNITVQGDQIQWQYDRWWYFDTTSNAWTAFDPPNDDYRWQLYPRAVFLSNGLNDGTILSFGSAIFCETGVGATGAMNTRAPVQYPGQGSYGGNPLQEIAGLPNGTRTSPIDPNSPAITVGGWNYANVVLMHTLIDRSVYVTSLSNYFLDRVIIHGGSQDAIADTGFPDSTDALPLVKEWNAGTLVSKADALQGRIFGNLVILPDGSLLAVGGRQAPGETYFKQTSRFWPGDDPLSPGLWESMADRRPVGTGPFTPRGYHSVALLLQDGSVALMGGRHEQDTMAYPDANSLDSVEIYQPPYAFEVQRLRITGTLGTMHYGTEFTFSVNKPNNVAYACLIGIGSVTHAFDYGQRYVELMATVAGNVTVWVPSDPDMLPEGYYLLFVVEERALPGGGFVRIPSVKGRFVKVTF